MELRRKRTPEEEIRALEVRVSELVGDSIMVIAPTKQKVRTPLAARHIEIVSQLAQRLQKAMREASKALLGGTGQLSSKREQAALTEIRHPRRPRPHAWQSHSIPPVTEVGLSEFVESVRRCGAQ